MSDYNEDNLKNLDASNPEIRAWILRRLKLLDEALGAAKKEAACTKQNALPLVSELLNIHPVLTEGIQKQITGTIGPMLDKHVRVTDEGLLVEIQGHQVPKFTIHLMADLFLSQHAVDTGMERIAKLKAKLDEAPESKPEPKPEKPGPVRRPPIHDN